MNNEKYPYDRVLLAYCCGGGVGGFIFGSLSGAQIILDNAHSNIIEMLLGIVFTGLIAMIFGLFVGFIPAIVTGALVALLKIELNTSSDYLKVGLIGFILIGIYIFPITFNNPYDINFLILAMVGGISSIIIASHVLPREVDYQQPFNINNVNNPPK